MRFGKKGYAHFSFKHSAAFFQTRVSMTEPASLTPAKYTLIVQDLQKTSDFYQHIIGLTPIDTNKNCHDLGIGNHILLSLHHHPQVQKPSRQIAGLYHSAFLLPSLTDFAHYLAHAVQHDFPIMGAADHLVSQGVYLSDPEGNGVEIYVDHPPSQWRDADGQIQMDSRRVDLQHLRQFTPKTNWQRLPEGTRIGHLHLQMGNLHQAEKFYQDILQFKQTYQMSGALFFASGEYHHHIAVNNWHAQAIIERPANEDLTGLNSYYLSLSPENSLIDFQQYLHSCNIQTIKTDTGLMFHDPWGLEVYIEQSISS